MNLMACGGSNRSFLSLFFNFNSISTIFHRWWRNEIIFIFSNDDQMKKNERNNEDEN